MLQNAIGRLILERFGTLYNGALSFETVSQDEVTAIPGDSNVIVTGR
jgi:hypothetical protein